MSTRTGKGKKRRKYKPDDPAQSRLFMKAAKALGLTDGKAFTEAVDKLLKKGKRRGSS